MPSRYLLEVSILANVAVREGARMSDAPREATPDYSKGSEVPRQGAGRLAALRGGLLILGLAGVVMLVIATFSLIIEIKVGTTADIALQTDTEQTGMDRHGPALLILAGFAALMLAGAARGARPATLAVAAAGIAVLAIALIWDLPDLDDAGEVATFYEDAVADPRSGYYLETLGGALLLLSGGGLAIAGRRARGAADVSEPRSAPT